MSQMVVPSPYGSRQGPPPPPPPPIRAVASMLTPNSANSSYFSPIKSESQDDARSSSSSTTTANASRQIRRRQKRNKPTLSCRECVERKTKVSRRREVELESRSRLACRCLGSVGPMFGVCVCACVRVCVCRRCVRRCIEVNAHPSTVPTSALGAYLRVLQGLTQTCRDLRGPTTSTCLSTYT
jgi:hypothetical protein